MEFIISLSRADVANIRRACTIAKNLELKHADECSNHTADRCLADRSWHLDRAECYQGLVDAFETYDCYDAIHH